MNVDSRSEQGDTSLEWVEEHLRALSAVEPPKGLKEKLRAGATAHSLSGAGRPHTQWWLGTAAWAGIAATIAVFCGVLWFSTPDTPAVGPEPDGHGGLGVVLAVDYNTNLGQMLAADHNSLRPPDSNALDSNSLQ